MSISSISLIAFIIFYFAIGIGTCFKFYEDLTPMLILKFILILPVQTLITTGLLFLIVSPKAYGDILEKRSEPRNVVYSFFMRPTVYFVSLKVCIMFMPIVSGRLAFTAIKNKNKFKHIIKKTRNDCYPLVANDIICHYV